MKATKQCPHCREVKPRAAFGTCASAADGLQSWCKTCKADYAKTPSQKARMAKYKRTPAGKASMRRSNFKRNAGITLPKGVDLLTTLLDAQGGVCAGCDATESGDRGGFHLDHPHGTDAVRAAFCGRCNRVEGLLRGDSDIARAAIEYVLRFEGRCLPPADPAAKLCLDCGEVKPRDAFTKDARAKDGLHHACRTCRATRDQLRRAGENFRRPWVAQLLAEQGGVCPVCKTAEPGKCGWQADHDTATNAVRGITCSHCNTAIGEGSGTDLLRLARIANAIDQAFTEQLFGEGGYDSDDPWTDRPRRSLIAEPPVETEGDPFRD